MQLIYAQILRPFQLYYLSVGIFFYPFLAEKSTLKGLATLEVAAVQCRLQP
jgi:hypothetical protein